MNLQDLAAISEIVGAVAVVISLIYLALQIRQNTKQIEENTNAVRASAVHASLSYGFDSRAATFTDEGTSTIYFNGLNAPSTLSEIELLRFRLIMSNIFDAIMNMHAQTKMTEFSPEQWEAQSNIAARILESEGGQWFWKEFKINYPKSFQIEMEKIIENRT